MSDELDAITQESTPPAETAGTVGDENQQEGYNNPGAQGPPTTPEVLPAAALQDPGASQGSTAATTGIAGGETTDPNAGGPAGNSPGPEDDAYAGKNRDDLKAAADERKLEVQGTGSNGYVTADDYKNALVADDQAKAGQ